MIGKGLSGDFPVCGQVLLSLLLLAEARHKYYFSVVDSGDFMSSFLVKRCLGQCEDR